MNCLKNSEIRKWLTGQGMRHQPMECGVPVAGEYHLPDETPSRLQLALDLSHLLAKDGTKMVEFIPPAEPRPEDLAQLDDFRVQFGEQRPLELVPGHLFKKRDRDDFRRMLTLALGFRRGWDLYIYSAPSGNSLRISSQIDLWAKKRNLRNALDRLLRPASRAA